MGVHNLWAVHTNGCNPSCQSRNEDGGRDLDDQAGWELRIVKRPRPGFEIVGPNWIVERTFAWIGRHRRLSKDYEFRVQSSEALITIAACALMLKRLAPS